MKVLDSWRKGQANAVAANKRNAAERVAIRTQKYFGPLSEREIALFKFARLVGYQDGQNVARRSMGRRVAA